MSVHKLQRIVLNINVENAAYGEDPAVEIERNFTSVIRSMGGSCRASVLYSTYQIRDTNGNVVGQAQGLGVDSKACPSCGWVMLELDPNSTKKAYACRNCDETWVKK